MDSAIARFDATCKMVARPMDCMILVSFIETSFCRLGVTIQFPHSDKLWPLLIGGI